MPPFVESLLEPFVSLFGPSHRVHLPYVLASLGFVVVAWLAARGRPGRAPLRRWLFPRRIFFHPSSRFDVAWCAMRGVVHALLVWPFRIGAIGVAMAVAGFAVEHVGRSGLTAPADRTWLFVAFTVALFLADDFTRFAVHRLMHAVPALWEIHKVHHSAEVLTPLTLYRVHPIESALNQARAVLTTGVVTGIFVWLYPGKLRALEILGVDAIGFAWTMAGASLRHSQAFVAWPAPLERLFVSPAQHQLHHAKFGAKSMNYGSALAIWDLAFGSLRIATHEKPPRIGLVRAEKNHARGLASALVDPVLAALSTVVRRDLRRRPFRAPAEKGATPLPPAPAPRATALRS